MKKTVMVLGMAVAMSAPAVAQSGGDPVDLWVGTDIVDGSLLEEGVETITNSITRAGETSEGPISWEELQVVWQNGKSILRHTSTVSRNGTLVVQDTTFYDAATLAPLSHYSVHTGRRTLHIWYGEDRVTGTRTMTDGTEEQVNVALERKAYDPSSLLLLTRALPLEEGFGASFPMFDHENLTVKMMSIWVVGKEWIETSDGGTEAWKVSINMGNADNPAEYWIDTNSRQSIKSAARWNDVSIKSWSSYQSE